MMGGLANSYEVELSVDAVSGTSWQKKQTAPRSSGTIVGLTSGARMWNRARLAPTRNLAPGAIPPRRRCREGCDSSLNCE